MIRVLIADDHAVVREGLKQILLENFEAVKIGEAKNAEEILEMTRKQDWDVVTLDVAMPGKNGLDVLKQMKRKYPRIPVLVLSVYPEDQYAVRVLQAGASGYMTKESAPDELVYAVRRVLKGGKYISPLLAEKLAESLGTDIKKLPHESLSDREYEVLRMIGSGKTVSEIANDLSLSVKTISTYRGRVLYKMKMKTNAELMRYAILNKLFN
jgi:two-component system, NarL family, invasion response regulator UvrY